MLETFTKHFKFTMAIAILSFINIYPVQAANNAITIINPIETTEETMPLDNQAKFVDNELIVMFKDDIEADKIKIIIENVGAEIISNAFDGKIITIQFPYPNTMSDIEAALATNEFIISVEKNYIVGIE